MPDGRISGIPRQGSLYLTCVVIGNTYMTHDSIDQSGQGPAVELRPSSAATWCPVARSSPALGARVRPVRTPSLSLSGGSDSSGPAGRSLRGYGADDAQTPGEN